MPSYSLRERTSGAIYAGVPTVDLGLECSRDDCTNKTNQRKFFFKYTSDKNFPYQVEYVIKPLNNQNHKSSGVEQGFHPVRCSPASNLYGIFASGQRKLKEKSQTQVEKENRYNSTYWDYIYFLRTRKKIMYVFRICYHRVTVGHS